MGDSSTSIKYGGVDLIEYRDGYYLRCLTPDAERFDLLKNFALRDDDVMVASFPKSGTTWLQHIVWMIHTNADFEHETQEQLDLRFPFLEFPYPGLDEIAARPSPRLVKTHLPYDLLPADVDKVKCKVIYIARNSKDVCTSLYFFSRMHKPINYEGNLEDFVKLFVDGQVIYGPYENHVLGYWKRREQDNLLFITYEDLFHRRPDAVRDIASFLGKSLTDEKVAQIVELSHFDKMKENVAVNYSWWDEHGMALRKMNETPFMRKGIVGDWQNHLTDEMAKTVEESCEQQLQKEGLLFGNMDD